MKIKCFSVFFCVMLALTSCGNKQKTSFGQKDTTPQPYQTGVLELETAELSSVYPATIKGREDIEIRPRVDGFIKTIHVDEGAVVHKGQALFTIDSPQTEQAVRTAEASVNSAKAGVNSAKTNVDRLRPLVEKGIMSDVQLTLADNSYQTALAALNQAEAVLTNAKATRSWATVTSPVDGVVGTISFRQGSLVTQSNVLTTVANISKVYAYFSLNEKDLITFLNTIPGNTQAQKIKNIPPVSLILADGTEYGEKGKVETISGVVSVTTGSAGFRAEFPNKQGFLRSGSSGKVIIPRSINNVPVIPQKSTFVQLNKTLVYKVQGDSVVQTIISVEGLSDGQRYAVTTGLSAGDRIVLDGVSTLSNGQKIIVK